MSNPMMLTDMVKLYVKPSLGGQIIMRKPTTHQTSAKVKAQQMNFANKMRGKKIAVECRGKKGRSFYGCLKTAGHNAYSGARA
jgi:hypothetical protein